MIDIVIFSILLSVIIPAGRTILRSIVRDPFLNPMEELFISFGLGAGFVGFLVLFMGMAGLLYKQVMIIIFATLFIIIRKDAILYFKDIYKWIRQFKFNTLPISTRLLIFLVIFIWFFSLMGALTPLLGTDAASYHMRIPKLFVEQHKISHIPYTRESLWPFLIQMLFTLGLLLREVVLAKLFNFAFGVFAIIGIYFLCRRRLSRTTSLITASVFASIPAIFTSAKYAYTDLAVVFYTLAAFYCFFLWMDKNKINWFYLSAIFCGFLLGVKVTSALVPLIIVFLFVYDSLMNKKAWKHILSGSILFAIILFAVSGVWYIRSWLILGNPVFPFAGYLFGGNGYAEKYLRYHTTSGIGMGLFEYIKLPWMLTFYPDLFGGESIGIVFLIFLPVLIFVKRSSKFIGHTIVTSIVLYTSWFIVYQYVRFLFPELIFLSILAAYSYSEICRKDRIIFKAATTAIILIFCYSAALVVYHNIGNVPVSLGIEKQEDYLKTRERSYKMAEYINNNLPKDAKIFVLGDPHLFYIDRYAVDAFCFKMDTRYDKFITNPNDFALYIKSQGFDYILHLEDLTPGRIGISHESPGDIFGEQNIEFVKEVVFNYKNEKYKYQLWKIKPIRRA